MLRSRITYTKAPLNWRVPSRRLRKSATGAGFPPRAGVKEQRPFQPSLVNLINVEKLIAADLRIRAMRRMSDEELPSIYHHFDERYSKHGNPSIPPETLLRGKALQALFTVRSDRQLCDRLQTDLMFHRFVDLPLDGHVFDASTYSKNHARLPAHSVADMFFAEVVDFARRQGWVSNEAFGFDGTLIESWASLNLFRPKDDQQGPRRGSA